MACITNNNGSSSRTMNFDVFVSFRGEDTRNNFTDHLFAALRRKGVVAFRDNQNINKGQLLEPELMQAIKRSRLFIVVFSKNYASSSWCLKELTMIFDWVKETGQSVLPIFYDVTPSEVRKQSGEFQKAFAEYEESFRDDLEMVKKLREAMKAIANRCGWDVLNKLQHEEIEKVVEEVINLLGHNQILNFGDDLVDMHSRVKQLEELVDPDANEVVRVIGISGMGGIGKTTLATALFDKISHQYDACCFIDDVSKIYGEFGPVVAQKQLLCQALNQGNVEINNLYQGTLLIRTRLCHLKVLIVLDNVDQDEQLEKLALHPKYLGVGSRILIISRDSHILRNYGVNEVYNVQLLNANKALQLFCRKTFKSDDILNDYEELTYDVLKYVDGLPLAIKVLGSFLFGRDVYEWRSALARLKEYPNKDIMEVLRISFDGLKEMEKEIFLDIACFFCDRHQQQSKGTIKRFLDYRGFFPDIGMKVLIEKSLITCDKWGVKMHDLLKELGRSIVREKSPNEPRKWSGLWDIKDLQNVMIKNEHLPNLIYLNLSHSKNLIEVPDLTGVPRLRRLILQGCINIRRIQPSIGILRKLVSLNLENCKNLIEMPDLTGVPRLRRLTLKGCINITRIHPSIGILRELFSLNLKNCKNLFHNLNIIFGLKSLKALNLSGCSKLLNNRLLKKSREAEHLENVDKNTSVIQLSTSSVYVILMLPLYFLSSHKHGDSLDLLLPYLSRFPCLRYLDLSFCNLLQIPDGIGTLQSLETLNLGGNKFVRLPTTIKELSNLQRLNLQHCKQLKYLPELPTTKKNKSSAYYGGLYIFNCPNLSEMEHCYHMVFSWMIQIFKAFLQSSRSLHSLRIVIPGTQIPRWFSKQNVGGSISVNLSPVIMEDPNWMGLACCSLLVAHHDPNNLNDRWQHDNFGSIGYNFQNIQVLHKSDWVLPILLTNDLVTGEIDHLFITFHSQETINAFRSPDEDEMPDLDKVGFTTVIFHHPKGYHLEVKNCGYRLVFKKDLQQLNLNKMFSKNSSSRKRKLLSSDSPHIIH
ncbi:TMV resistance protein N isoform X2 [Cajanus cajan]|uniref:TMV resistance protein N isoform X2 n=1 Tax=Cajanus cajan TaxID=3821 RepID=UPI0010FAED50|nr:TMV resistance protein N isoform X2 [Cajanus cajan]